MKLLRFVAESDNNIDEVLMVVADVFDRELASREATDMIGDCHIENEVELWEVTGTETSGMSEYRPYVG